MQPNDEKSHLEQPRRQQPLNSFPNEEALAAALYFPGMVAPYTPVIVGTTELEMRAVAYSQAHTLRLEQHRSIATSFREQWLADYPGHMLPPGEMVRWIRTTAERDDPASRWLHDLPEEAFELGNLAPYEGDRILLKKGWERRIRQPDAAAPPPEWGPVEEPHWEYKFLAYMVGGPGKPTVERVPVSAKSPLNQLRRQSSVLVEKYCRTWANDPNVADPRLRHLWGLARAATYVLTGYIPLIAPEQIPLPAGRGVRPQSPKHLQLGVYTLQETNQSARSRLEIWNQRYPQWSYAHEKVFANDSATAVRRLLGVVPAIESGQDAPFNADGSVSISISRRVVSEISEILARAETSDTGNYAKRAR